MTYLSSLYAPIFSVVLLLATPALTLVLMRRAGVRGIGLSLVALPPLAIILGAVVFQYLMMTDSAYGYLSQLAVAKTIAVSIGAISPLLILALIKWPVLDNSLTQVETHK